MTQEKQKEIGLPVDEVYQPPARVREGALVQSMEEYQQLYERSINDREGFWSEIANRYLEWIAPFDKVVEEDLTKGHIRWFINGKLNVTVNCLDRPVRTQPDKVAIIWGGDEPGTNRRVTYRELYEETCRLATELRARGIRKGDRIAIYMGMVPELAVAMLACARIGAIHSVIFGGFSPRSIRDRVDDSQCRAIITQDEGRRGGRVVPLKHNVDEALKAPGHTVEFTIVLKRSENEVPMDPSRDSWWHDVVPKQPAECEPEVMDAEDPLFILYTSGSTGKPKGVLHTQAGYLLFVMLSHKYVFDIRDDDIYCCAADVGWI